MEFAISERLQPIGRHRCVRVRGLCGELMITCLRAYHVFRGQMRVVNQHLYLKTSDPPGEGWEFPPRRRKFLLIAIIFVSFSAHKVSVWSSRSGRWGMLMIVFVDIPRYHPLGWTRYQSCQFSHTRLNIYF